MQKGDIYFGENRMMLVTAVETLDEEKVERLVKIGLERGADPLDIIEDVRQGMEKGRVSIQTGKVLYC